MGAWRKFCLGAAGAALIPLGAGLAAGRPGLWEPAAIAAAVGLALGAGGWPALRSYQFTAWIVVAVVAAMIYPQAFQHWGRIDLRNPWLLLFIMQAVMFGMGTQMSLRDFAGVARAPRGVLVGIGCHYTVMPLVGLALTRIFHFPAEIAAGVILIGSCSSGLASNVMAYLARANLPLSVTVTAVSTMLAPFLTPLWMKLLAGTLVEVSFFKMMMEIVEIVIVPIGAALLHDYLKHAPPSGRRRVHAIAIGGAVWLAFLALGGWAWLAGVGSEGARSVAGVGGFFAGAVIFGVVYHRLVQRLPLVDRLMPSISMAGIVYFVTMTTAAGRDNLLQVGALLFLASALHNAAGYCFGYFLSRGAGLDVNSARSVAFEVGLQNGGMASGLAGAMGKLGTVGLAAAIFSPWMNVSGSVLANYWKRRPPRDAAPAPAS
ncbi:MAG TPA: bile acid:sodium symporter family protein [Opitutaceae bacterium]|nr:bile acid:sodium symporter family protein [Opitutaceae bacterium]